jgi:hypothetical protein
MAIIVSGAYALSRLTQDDADFPIVGWRNLVSATTVTADEEETLYPATNLATPATNELWKSGSTDDQYVTVLFGTEVEVDYVGLAGHNFGSGLVETTTQGLPAGGNPADDGDWVELVPSALPAGDEALLLRFDPTYLIGVRLLLEPDAVAPQAAVLHVGKLLVFERGVQPGHTPIVYGRDRDVISGLSQSGQFLGRVVSGGRRRSAVSIIKLSAAWYRSTLDPFFEVAASTPFFWAWSPERYPDEVGYVWLTNQPVPMPGDLAGYIDIQMQMEGLL